MRGRNQETSVLVLAKDICAMKVFSVFIFVFLEILTYFFGHAFHKEEIVSF